MKHRSVNPRLFSRPLPNNVVYLCMRGQVTRRVCVDAFDEFREAMASMESPRLLIDAIDVPSYHADAVPVGFQYFQHYRSRGGGSGVFACSNRVTLMAKNLISTVTGVELNDASSLTDACALLGVPISALDGLEYPGRRTEVGQK